MQEYVWCGCGGQIGYFQGKMLFFVEYKRIEGDLLCETILTLLVSNSHRKQS